MARAIARSLDPVLFAEACGVTPDPWQAKFLRSNSKRTILNCSRQSGKSTVCAVKALNVAVHEPGALVVIVSPSQRQSAELLRTIRGLHAKLDDAPALANESVLKLELESGSRLLALPGADGGKTVRGLAGAKLVIFDEASRCDPELFTACRPMIATSNGALILLSTPAGRRGTFFDIWHNGEAWERVRVAASDCPRISAEFLASERKELGEARFAEEFELAFIDSDTQAFPTHLIDRAFNPNLKAIWI